MPPPITRRGEPWASTHLPDPEALVRSAEPQSRKTSLEASPIQPLGVGSGSGAARPPRFRSSLTKSVENGQKQYKLNGEPIGPSYPAKGELEQPSTEQRSEIAKKHSSVVYQRRNPASPYVRKIKTDSVRETQELIEVRNELARFVDAGPRSKHFAVEIFAGEIDGSPSYIARRINGFPLSDSDSLIAARNSGELSTEELRTKMDELSDAVKWLNDSGYFHNDVQLENIMYDRDNKTMVLIDFEHANRTQRWGSSGEQGLIDTWKEVVSSQ